MRVLAYASHEARRASLIVSGSLALGATSLSGQSSSTVIAGVAAVPSSPNHDSTYRTDLQHPDKWVAVTEETAHRHRYCLFAPASSTREWCSLTHSSNNPSGEVDRRSRLYIHFDREFLQKFIEVLNSDVTVEAFLSKQDGSQPPVEVPGYSVVGQQARVASVRFRTGHELVLSLGDLQGTADTLRNRLREIEWFTPTPAGTGPGASTAASLSAELMALQTAYRAVLDSIADIQHSVSDSLRSTRSLADSLATYQKFLAADTVRLLTTYRTTDTLSGVLRELYRHRDSLAASSREANLRYEQSRSNAQQDARRMEVVRLWRGTLLDAEKVLQTQLTPLVSDADSTVFNIAARVVSRDPTTLRERANEIITIYKELEAAPDTDTRTIQHAGNAIMSALADVRTLGEQFYSRQRNVLEQELVRRLVAQLKDTYLLVAESGAQTGDYLTVVVSSKSSDSELPRQLRVRLLVREFGLVQRTSDSFLFLNRKRNIPAFGGTSADTIAAAYNYFPTAGVTFGWTLEHRRDWGGTGLSTLMRWLEPGFGFNVSFPRFTTQVRRPNGAGGVDLVALDDAADRFDLALGAVATLFGGAVQMTYGRNLTADRDRTYWGIGFSFLRTISEVKQRISAIQ